MASLFECEVRFKIKDIKVFKKRLKELDAKFLFPYSFNDYYFRPEKGKWNPEKENIRIREWKKPKRPTKIFFVKNEILSIDGMRFKRAFYPEGKVCLFKGDRKTCQNLLQDLNFKPWFIIKKQKALFWDLPKYRFKTIAEWIPELGWWGELEFEGKDPKKAKVKIENALKVLNIPKSLATYKSMSAIFADKQNRGEINRIKKHAYK